MDKIKEAFWSPSFWLPPNSTWEKIRFSSDEHQYSRIEDIYTAWYLVPAVIATKYIIEKYIFVKIAAFWGLKEEHRRQLPSVDILENAFRTNSSGKWSEKQLAALSKQSDWSTEQIRNWFRRRKTLGNLTEVKKFCESLWRLSVYFCFFTFGLITHWSEDWFWDTKLFWENFPQPPINATRCYFIIVLANYSSWCFSHFTDVRRKDPGLMLYHHVASVTALCIMWMSNFHRWFIPISLAHDVGDIFIEASKVLKYLGFKTACKVMFVLCTIVWIITRDIIFPFYLIPCGLHNPQSILQMFPFKRSNCSDDSCDISPFKFTATHLLLMILCTLFSLHVYWTFFILKVLFVAVTADKLEDDVASNDEDENEIYSNHGCFNASTISAFSNFAGKCLSFPRSRDNRFYQRDS